MEISEKRYLGIDIGSISIAAAAIDRHRNVLDTKYVRHQGAPDRLLQGLIREMAADRPFAIRFTGTGGEHAAGIFGASCVNEIIAAAAGFVAFGPPFESIIEMGGQGSKYYLINEGRLTDFSTSGLCAAGTGSFLDQQAARLNVKIEKEFGELALRSENPPHIAGRCSVFAKSDMIHHQQIGTPDYDILAGLCHAVARNYKSTILGKRTLRKPVAFIGGVALNAGVVKAFRCELGLEADELVVPDYPLYYTAFGAALKALEEESAENRSFTLDFNAGQTKSWKGEPPLRFDRPSTKHYAVTSAGGGITSDKGYLGIDIGSLSTNIVVIDSEGNVMARRYLMTEGRPIKTVQRGLKEIAGELDGKVKIAGVGTTGSGRYLIGEIVGADIVRNEITAQATAAVFFEPEVDTVFEIGGQDSKYISIENGVVVDFEMNKACAAGTGSFLQEQAERLNISIENDFGNLALQSSNPVGCGERCTVFIESDIISRQQQGAPREDLVAGLAYSIVRNYLNKVVGRRRIGDRILFQGGVAWNKGVVAAFENVTGREIIVPPHHDVTGAIGAALLAVENVKGQTRFKGFGVADINFVQESFVCDDCANVCTIRRITGDGDRELYYGSRCEKYDAQKSGKAGKSSANQVEWRNNRLFSYGRKPGTRGRIGLPRLLSNWTLWPFWSTFFNELGFRIVPSSKTNQTIIRRGAEVVGSETCFPVKVAHGHILNLLEKKVDHIFLPSIINMSRHAEEQSESYICPYVQSIPYLAAAVLAEKEEYKKVISPTIYFGHGRKLLRKQVIDAADSLNCRGEAVYKALEKAELAQAEFADSLIEQGKKIIAEDSRIKLVLVGRPYNTCDPGLNLDLARKITDLDAVCLPLDMVPVENAPVDETYWHFGKIIIRLGRFIAARDDVYAVYITNFGCGPDSFISHEFNETMGGKPYLQLELDEHSADAGLITRIEAFLDSVRGRKKTRRTRIDAPGRITTRFNRKVYIPRMSDQAILFEAALKRCGVDAEALPESDEETLQLGRRYTSGKECFPAVVTTGDLVKLVQSSGFDPDKSAFFMPSAGGPCRFGQYHRLHRRLLANLGYPDVPIYSPHSANSYNDFPGAKEGFRKIAWRGFVFGDYLFKIYLSARARCKDKSLAEKIFNEGFRLGCQDIIYGANHLDEILREYSIRLGRVDDGIRPKVKIGVVGEIYIRNNRFSNNNLIEKLERFGAEVYIASFIEWIDYTTFMYKFHSSLKGKHVDYVKACLKDYFQSREKNKIGGVVDHMLDGNKEKPVKHAVERARKYLSTSIGGEAVLSIGKAIEFVEGGCGGIVNCMPFTCMPGNITQAISSRVSADLGNVPWLNIAYEGPGDPTEDLKIEAFVSQAAEWINRPRKQVIRS